MRVEKLALLHEVLFDYGADGVELDFMFEAAYFKQADIASVGISTFNSFLADVRALAVQAGQHFNKPAPPVMVWLERHALCVMMQHLSLHHPLRSIIRRWRHWA